MAAPKYPGDPFGRLPHPVRPVRDPLPTEPAPFITRRAGPVLGGPLYRPAARERRAWTLLEVVGAAALSGTWLWMLWTVLGSL
jgi:hypothetical protein